MTFFNFSLKEKGAVITGAASGFGKQFALELARRQSDIILVDVQEEKLEEVTQLIKKETSQKVIPIICDVSNSVQVEKMAKDVFNELDNVYILFNNAGISPHYGLNIFRTKEAEYDQIMNINLKGEWLIAKYICKKMKKQKFEPISGKVIFTSSITGVKPNSALPIYSISKAGVIAMTKIFAQDLAPKLTVNSISPGYHVTPIYNNDPDLIKNMIKEGGIKTPLNRLGTIEDVIKVLIFLASPLSNFITGHNFIIDGGIAEAGVPARFIQSDI
jgi:3-oxoacyl-[acyl-carrier protein] reductase